VDADGVGESDGGTMDVVGELVVCGDELGDAVVTLAVLIITEMASENDRAEVSNTRMVWLAPIVSRPGMGSVMAHLSVASSAGVCVKPQVREGPCQARYIAPELLMYTGAV
jgi:hypothetical protein